MKRLSNFYILIIVALILFSCKEKTQNLSLEQVKYNSNKSSYSDNKLNNSQVINKITKQKVREVLELSILFNSGNKDTEIDEALKNQILGYFYKPDSTALQNLLTELNNMNVQNAKINSFELRERYFKKDTLKFAQFNVEYFDQNNVSLGTFDREAQYVLIPAEIQFKKEFKFYFLNFYNPPIKDSISTETTNVNNKPYSSTTKKLAK